MAKLSNAEMAVLNSLVYIDIDYTEKDGKKLGEIIEEIEKNDSWSRPESEISREECRETFRAIKNNPSLQQLEIFQKKELDYSYYSDARILTLKNGDTPIVIFHGTSGKAEEEDNYAGANLSDTNSQKKALEYINRLHDDYGYENISVTGHSKGGNKAMYVAVLSDYVTDCVAVDGQGFSQKFVDKYLAKIEAKKNNITLLAPDQSIVNACLRNIAGITIYISTEGIDEKSAEFGGLPFHKPNIVFYIDEDGNPQLRNESTRALIPDIVNLFTEIVSGGCWIFEKGEKLLQIIGAEIAGGKPANALALSVRIGSLLAGTVPGVSEEIKAILTSSKKFFGLENGIDAVRLLEVTAIVLAARIALSSGFITAIANAVIAVVAVWAVVKILEEVIPTLIKSGIDLMKAIGLAIEMAVSWIAEKLADIGKAAIEGFHKAVDDAVRLGQLAVDAARAVKEAVSGAVKNFLSNAGKFFDNIGKGAKNWIGGIFGTPGAAIQHAQRIHVTMSKIEEMQKHLSSLQQSYEDAKKTSGNASFAVNSVYNYYSESYVRSCCREIQNQLKKAQGYINLAERELDRKRKVLAVAAESYRRADREAVDLVKNYT
ncbi:hypothetical protein C808_04978 [Lachnospiraceae bacterium M18-1]|nr:hypothetical protein C808_04978 [Lachnospiraceae bacterium M18-1]